MASEVDVVDALRECAEAWEPDVCVLGNVQARDVVAVCERLRAAEAERDAARKALDAIPCSTCDGAGTSKGRGMSCPDCKRTGRGTWQEWKERFVEAEKEREDAKQLAQARLLELGQMQEELWSVEMERNRAVKERDQAREREAYALDAIERNDERHAEALRAVRQRAERAEQTRDAHAEALAQAAREAGEAADKIAALAVERDDARSLLAHAERAIEQGTGDCLLVDHLKRALMERDEARAALIRSQEDHRAAVEALETYEERIGDIADHVLGLVPPDVPSIVKLDAIERRCGEERVAARQAERERDEARAALAKLEGADVAMRWFGRLMFEANKTTGRIGTLLGRERKARRAAEARVAELEAECASMSAEFGLPPTIRPAEGEIRRMVEAVRRLAVLERIADAAAAVVRYEWGDPAKGCDVDCIQVEWMALRNALAARGKDGAK